MVLGLKNFEDSFCIKQCGEKVMNACWRRKQKDPCRLHRLYQEERKEEIRQEKIASIESKEKKKEMDDVLESDLLDSKGDDISDEEYLENEKSFCMEEL